MCSPYVLSAWGSTWRFSSPATHPPRSGPPRSVSGPSLARPANSMRRKVRQLDELVTAPAGHQPTPTGRQLAGLEVAEQRPLFARPRHHDPRRGELPDPAEERVEQGSAGATD